MDGNGGIAGEEGTEEEGHGEDGKQVGGNRQKERKGAVAVRNLVDRGNQ